MMGKQQHSNPPLDRAFPYASIQPEPTVPAEGLPRKLRGLALGIAWSLKPERAAGLLPMLALTARHYLDAERRGSLPDPESALANPDGLAGICDMLTPEIALSAYRRGLFPWSHVGPQKWWAIARRSTLFFENFRVEKGVRRALRQDKFHVTFDKDFDAVIRACAAPRDGRVNVTWIRPRIVEVFNELHALGHAHSVEVWNQEGALVGGAYGLAIGKVFFTESQFFRARDASKVGFAVLNRHLQHWGFAINDAKEHTLHLNNLGFREVARDEHNDIVSRFASARDRTGNWNVDPFLEVANWQPEQAPGLRLGDILSLRRDDPSDAPLGNAGGSEQ